MKTSKLSRVLLYMVLIMLCILFTACGVTRNRKTDMDADTGRYVKNIFQTVDTIKDIPYTEVLNYKEEKETLLLDIYTPADDTQNNRPAIIWLHGGGLVSGSKDEDGLERYLAVEFAKKGYVCISINYRIREKLDDPSAAITDAVDDTASAVSWVIEHSEEYGIDKKFIAVGGYSAGALTAINFGYSDFKKYGIDKSNVFGVIDIAGDTLYKKRVAKEDPPCIIIQGTQDPKSSLESSKKLAKMLNDQNIYNVLYTIEGADHNLMILYDDVVNQTTMFLYEALTGNSIEVNDISGISVEYEKVIQRVAENPYYDAKQVNLTVDGKLDEWTGMEAISLNQCKDSGDGLPEKDDFSGTVMIGWNEQDSHRIYIAAKIVDDILWDKPVEEDKWYMNDCLEIALDVSADNIAAPVQKCVVATSGTKLSALANDENVECVVVKQGNEYTFEMAIDITKLESIVDITHDFSILAEDIIGLSVCYNDCENEVREHQIGWTPGKASNRGTFGNVRFVTEHVK